jgi:hypothetical protein
LKAFGSSLLTDGYLSFGLVSHPEDTVTSPRFFEEAAAELTQTRPDVSPRISITMSDPAASDIAGIVTAPINKEALHAAAYPFDGHIKLLVYLTVLKNEGDNG